MDSFVNLHYKKLQLHRVAVIMDHHLDVLKEDNAMCVGHWFSIRHCVYLNSTMPYRYSVRDVCGAVHLPDVEVVWDHQHSYA